MYRTTSSSISRKDKTMSEMKTLVIDRKKWHRGKGPEQSRLLIKESTTKEYRGKMCCLGFYLKSEGCTDNQIDDMMLPSMVFALPSACNWLLYSDPSGHGQRNEEELAMTNDNTTIDDPDREDLIKTAFALQDVRVTFID
jgi:hypothetical protein